MGINTIGKITTNPTYKEVQNGLIKIGAKNVEIFNEKQTIYKKDFNSKTNKEETYVIEGSASIYFQYKGDKRKMFCIHGNLSDETSFPFLENKHFYMSLGCSGNSIEIMEKLLSIFSGYLIPSDAESIDDPNYFKFIKGKKNYKSFINIKEKRKIPIEKKYQNNNVYEMIL